MAKAAAEKEKADKPTADKEKADKAEADHVALGKTNFMPVPFSVPGASTDNTHSIDAQRREAADLFTPTNLKLREMELDEK